MNTLAGQSQVLILARETCKSLTRRRESTDLPAIDSRLRGSDYKVALVASSSDRLVASSSDRSPESGRYLLRYSLTTCLFTGTHYVLMSGTV